MLYGQSVFPSFPKPQVPDEMKRFPSPFLLERPFAPDINSVFFTRWPRFRKMLGSECCHLSLLV